METFWYGLGLGFAVYSLVLIAQCVFRVEEGCLAVKTTFGRAQLSDENSRMVVTYGPGLHFKWPWEKQREISMMERIIDLSGEEGGVQAMAQDGTILRLDSKLRFSPMKEELYHYLFSLRNPMEHIKGLFTCLLRNEIANFRSESDEERASAPGSPIQPGSYALIRRERKLLNQYIENFCRSRIGGHYGVKFNAVDLTDILPPDELAEALNAVMNAQTESETLYARGESECRQRVLASAQGVAIARERAKATETEILKLGEYLEDLERRKMLRAYVERRRAEVRNESRALFVLDKSASKSREQQKEMNS
jgi:regulator of protease activity HflC (stomatin/prohibitin superfamily)